jgi:chemosensory pili system protein ChpA (sensor histidine kinase/response regulator)
MAAESDLLDLIFEPGFSTSAKVTSLSGRGVGMDVVRKNLEEVRGSVSIQTEAGEGTTFTIAVPYTLSVVRVLLIESANMLLAIPTDAVEEIIALNTVRILSQMGRQYLLWDELMLPFLSLKDWLKFPPSLRWAEQDDTPLIETPMALICALDNDSVAINVDRYWGEQEVTIRQVEGNIALPNGFSGCTILGDGRIVPLVDVVNLLTWVNSQQPLTLQHAMIGQEEVPEVVSNEPALVMVVDDSVNVRRFLVMTLEKSGYRVEQAKDGQQALEKLQTGLPVEAIICDVEMPRLDGFGFLAQMKSQPTLKKIPVAMLTSRSGPKHRQLAMNLGASAYFSKPFQEQDLLQTLAQFTQA